MTLLDLMRPDRRSGVTTNGEGYSISYSPYDEKALLTRNEGGALVIVAVFASDTEARAFLDWLLQLADVAQNGGYNIVTRAAS